MVEVWGAMDSAAFYCDVEDRFCQGDIFDVAPHLFLKEKQKSPQALSLAGKKAGCFIDELSGLPFLQPGSQAPSAALPEFPKQGMEVTVPASALVERAILLSHGCEIDKDKRHRIIALIRPLTSLTKEEEKNHVRSNGRKACFYLPPLGAEFQEGYIDFRRISTVSLEWLESKRRVKSLSEKARRQMLLALFVFFSRLSLDGSVFEAEEQPEGN